MAVAACAHHGDAAGGDLVIAELLRLDLAQARDHVVAERAGGEGPVRLDQRDLQFRIDLLAARARSSRRQSRRRSRRRAPRLARTRAAETPAPPRVAALAPAELPAAHAMAGAMTGAPLLLCRVARPRSRAISSSEKPLAMRFITVAGSEPSRNAGHRGRRSRRRRGRTSRGTDSKLPPCRRRGSRSRMPRRAAAREAASAGSARRHERRNADGDTQRFHQRISRMAERRPARPPPAVLRRR